MPRHAFTLVEILVAMAVAMTLLAIAAFAQHNLGRAVDRGSGLVELYVQAGTITDSLQADFGAMQPTAVLHAEWGDQSDADPHQRLVFVRGFGLEAIQKFNQHSGLDVTGDYHDDQVWVAWDFRPSAGLRHAVSPETSVRTVAGSWTDEIHYHMGDNPYAVTLNGESARIRSSWDAGPLPTRDIGRTAVSQRYWRYFDNRGDASDPTKRVAEAAVSAWLNDWEGTDVYGSGSTGDFEPMLPMHASAWNTLGWRPYNNRWNWGWADPLLPLRAPAPISGTSPIGRFYLLGNQAPIDVDGDGQADAHASELPPPNDVAGTPAAFAVPFNKSRLFLLGAQDDEGNDYYNDSLQRVADNLEFVSFEIIDRNGLTLPVDATAQEHNYDGLSLFPEHYGAAEAPAGATDPRQAALAQRPSLVRVRFVLHSMPEAPGYAIIDEMAEDHTINRLRWEFYNELTAAERSHELLKRMIESRGYVAIVIEQSFTVE